MVGLTNVPLRGDAIWIGFNPQTGHEQVGRRPAVVLTTKDFNDKTSLVVLCPITRSSAREQWNPFAITIPEGLEVDGVILADQIRTMGWRARRAEYICSLPTETVDAVLERIRSASENIIGFS